MNVMEERAATLLHQVRDWELSPQERSAIERRLATRWKSNGVLASAVFFVLTLVAVAALFGLCDLMRLPKGWITAVVSIAVAETLIWRLHFFGTGIESALWLGGLFAWIFGLPSEGRPEGLLLFGAACLIAGVRVRNPLIGAASAVFVISYLGAKSWFVAAPLAGIALAVIALALLAREWQRPSTEMLLVILMIVTPVTGAAWSFGHTSMAWSIGYIALAVAEFTFGVMRRHRGALLCGAVSIVIAFIVAREIFDFLAIEWKLIAAGVALFATSIAIARSLRGKTRGFVITPVKSAFEDAVRVFGSAAFSPQTQPQSAPHPIGGGGRFGGAGSSGSF